MPLFIFFIYGWKKWGWYNWGNGLRGELKIHKTRRKKKRLKKKSLASDGLRNGWSHVFNWTGGGGQKGWSPPGVPGCQHPPQFLPLQPQCHIRTFPDRFPLALPNLLGCFFVFFNCFTTAWLSGWLCHFFVFFQKKEKNIISL